MTLSTVTVQTTPESQPSTPGWMGEVAAFAQILSQTGLLTRIEERVRFARARMGTYDLIDFVAVLMGYALSGEPTLRAFYNRLLPFADPFMALFGRKQLPSRSALSRWLAALDQASVESLRTLFQEDLLARKPFADPGGIRDRCGQSWLVADVDGTRKAARQRALPQAESLPAPHRRFDQVCAKGYQGRKRGEVVRVRTVVLQAHTHQFLGTFGGAGNGDYRGELLRAIGVLKSYAKQVAISIEHIVIRLDDLPLLSTLLANSLRRVIKAFKSRNPGRSKRIVIEPGNKANQIDRCCNAKMLQMRLWQSHLPRTPQIKGAHSLRDSGFNPCTQSILLLEGVSPLDLPGDLEGRVLRLRPDR